MMLVTTEENAKATEVPCACGCGNVAQLGPGARPAIAMTAPCYVRHRDMLHRATMRLWQEAREVWARFVAARREATGRDGAVDREALEKSVLLLMRQPDTRAMLGGPYREWLTGPDGFFVQSGLRSEREEE